MVLYWCLFLVGVIGPVLWCLRVCLWKIDWMGQIPEIVMSASLLLSALMGFLFYSEPVHLMHPAFAGLVGLLVGGCVACIGLIMREVAETLETRKRTLSYRTESSPEQKEQRPTIH